MLYECMVTMRSGVISLGRLVEWVSCLAALLHPTPLPHTHQAIRSMISLENKGFENFDLEIKISRKINQLWIFQFAPVVDSAENIPPRQIRNFVSAKFSASSLDYYYRYE